MTHSETLPRILIIDDLFGRDDNVDRNVDRENLCAHLLLEDITGDSVAGRSRLKIQEPVGQAFFCRGQLPLSASVGSVVENDLPGALSVVREGWQEALNDGRAPWSLVLLDLCFYTGVVSEESQRHTPGVPVGHPDDDDPDNYFGLTLLDAIHADCPELPVIILSSKPRDSVSLEFSRRGALGFIARDDLRAPELLQEAIWQHGLLPDSTGQVTGNSLPLLIALREARRAAAHGDNLLLRGERGTGKEVMASYVHRARAGLDPKCPFVTVNSAVLRTELFASELFGIEPRTASGVDGKIGLVEVADGGDLFLDEIADMPADVQAAILRTLQDRQITRVGARQSMEIDVRFVSATNADLEQESRGFRQDLLDRLRLGGTIWLPPLRERLSDIPLLAERFVREAESQRPGTLRREISGDALTELKEHDWPGNVRELRACIFDAVSRFPGVEHLVPGHLRLGRRMSRLDESLLNTDNQQDSIDPSLLSPQIADLDSWLGAQALVQFHTDEISTWAGRLGELQHAQTWVLARYLLAALEATKRRTPESPEGVLQIHPAVKMITGDTSITASRAADIIKRLLTPLESELEGDLREALSVALRLRPRSPRTASLGS